MKEIKVKKTYRTFKIGNNSFSANAFHPLRYERGVYIVHIHQNGKPFIDKYMYLTQVRAKNGAYAIAKVKKELLQKFLDGKYLSIGE